LGDEDQGLGQFFAVLAAKLHSSGFQHEILGKGTEGGLCSVAADEMQRLAALQGWLAGAAG